MPLCSSFLQMPVGMRVSHMCSCAHPGAELSSDHEHGASARPGSSQVTIPADPRDLTWGPLVSAPHFPPLCVGIWPRPRRAPCGTDGVARGKSGHWLWLVGKAPGAGQPSPWLGKREGGSAGLPVPAASAGLFGLTIVLWLSGRGEPVWSVPRRTICSVRVKEPGQMRRGPVLPEPPGTQGGCPSRQGLARLMEGRACLTAMTDAPGRAPLLPQSCPARTVSVQEGGVTPVQEQTCRPPGCTCGFPWDTLQSSRCGRPRGQCSRTAPSSVGRGTARAASAAALRWRSSLLRAASVLVRGRVPAWWWLRVRALRAVPEPAGSTGASPHLAASAHTWIVFAWLLWVLPLEETRYRVALEI